MCGIVGFSGGKDFTGDPAVISLLLMWNSKERGNDGTGIYLPDLGVLKNRNDASRFLAEHYKKLDELDNIIVSHVRRRSMGQITDDTAQPFRVTTPEVDIIGAHNGHITNYKELREMFCPSEIVDSFTDSHALFQSLAWSRSFGPLLHYQGSVAMLMTDARSPEKTIWAYRDSEKPLFRGKRIEGMYFSSVAEALNAAGCTDVIEIKPNLVYIIKEGKINHYLKVPARVIPVRPVTHTNVHTGPCCTTTREEAAKGRWVRMGASLHKDANIKHGEWYYCNDVITQQRNLGYVTEKLLQIKLAPGKYRNYNPYLFDIYPYEFNHGSKCRLMVDIAWKTGRDAGQICAKAGDAVDLTTAPNLIGDAQAMVTTYDDSGALHVKHMTVNVSDLLLLSVYNLGAKHSAAEDDEDPYTTYMQQFAN